MDGLYEVAGAVVGYTAGPATQVRGDCTDAGGIVAVGTRDTTAFRAAVPPSMRPPCASLAPPS